MTPPHEHGRSRRRRAWRPPEGRGGSTSTKTQSTEHDRLQSVNHRTGRPIPHRRARPRHQMPLGCHVPTPPGQRSRSRLCATRCKRSTHRRMLVEPSPTPTSGALHVQQRGGCSPADSSPTGPRPNAPSSSPNDSASVTRPRPSWAPVAVARKAFTRHELGMPTRNREAVRRRAIDAARQRSGRPPPPAWTRYLWRSTTASSPPGPGRVGSWPSGSAVRRTMRCWVRGWWWSCTAKATPPNPAPARGRSPAARSAPSTVWVPDIRFTSCDLRYSWISPPSRSRRTILPDGARTTAVGLKWRCLPQRAVRAVAVVMVDVLASTDRSCRSPRSASDPIPPGEPCPPTAPRRRWPAAPAPACAAPGSPRQRRPRRTRR